MLLLVWTLGSIDDLKLASEFVSPGMIFLRCNRKINISWRVEILIKVIKSNDARFII